MAQFGESFIADELPQGGGEFAPLPDGWYTAVINKADLKPTKDGSGKYIAVRYDIIAPTHQGRIVFGNINIKNKSTTAEEIGRQQLGSLMRAIGLARVDDTDQLIGATLQIKLATRTQEGYEPNNDIKAFKAVEGAAMSMPAMTAPTTTTTKASPPWAKK